MSESILQRHIRLAELLDLESFREVMKSFADLYHLGIKVLDSDGNKMVDVRVGSGPFCAYLFEQGPTRVACTKLVGQLKTVSIDETSTSVRQVTCFSGLRYALMPIVYEGDVLGRVIFGPYWPREQSGPVQSLLELAPGLDSSKLVELAGTIRSASDAGVNQMLGQLRQVIDVILYTSYRAMLTSQMHIESITQSYKDLIEKNRQLAENNERLQELDRVKSDFLAVVSHELRTPLTSIIGYAEMLSEGMAGSLNTEQNEFVTTIMEKGENLLQLISSLLDVSRIEAGKMKMQWSDLEIGETVASAVSSVMPQIAKKKIRFIQRTAEDLPRISADRDKVRQILINLLANAVKFTPEHGEVKLEIDRYFGAREQEDMDRSKSIFELGEEDFLRLRVIDSGVGIPSSKTKRIFESFYQVDSSSTREYGGTGLGLSIVKSFVDAHKGQVWVESSPGEGAVFSVLLPTARD